MEFYMTYEDIISICLFGTAILGGLVLIFYMLKELFKK